MILFIFGTRPEIIKLAPLILKLKNLNFNNFFLCNTEQQKDLSSKILSLFNLKADFSLNIMKEDQTLSNLSANLLIKINDIIIKNNITKIIVHGDTTSAFIGALASYYNQISLYHIEAGLRTNNIYSPFPEEINRLLISKIAIKHFAPTIEAKNNLIKENIDENKIFLTGNTVVEALKKMLNKVENNLQYYSNKHNNFNYKKKLILLTCHRRENFCFIQNVINSILNLSSRDDIEFIIPVHPNPNVKKIFHEKCQNILNIHLLEPLDYDDLVYIINKCYFIITDSGGIQEEAPSLGKPVLILRNETERNEIIEAKIGKLIGLETANITKEANILLDNQEIYNSMAKKIDLYGDEKTIDMIIKEII